MPYLSVSARRLDWVNLVLGVLLFISPWVIGFVPVRAGAWNAWVVGVIVFVLAIAALTRFAEWEEWLGLVLGIWTFIASWVLGLMPTPGAFWTHIVLGALIAIASAWEIWQTRHVIPVPHAPA